MKKYNQKSKTAIYPISFKDFDVFEFYNEYKNLKRIYLFNLLNEFNFISEHNGTLSITFDTLTKIGLFLQNIDVKNRGNYNSCSLAQVSKLNKIFIEFVLNSRIGHAMPIFKYDNEIYTNGNKKEKIFDLDTIEPDFSNELKLFVNETLNNKLIIFSARLSGNNLLVVEYQKFDLLESIR